MPSVSSYSCDYNPSLAPALGALLPAQTLPAPRNGAQEQPTRVTHRHEPGLQPLTVRGAGLN